MNNFKVPENNKTDEKPVMARNPLSAARVFGLPISRELESFIDDAVPNNDQKRIFNMFFAGRFGASVQMIAEDEEEGF